MLFRQIIAVALAGFGLWACGSGASKEAVGKAEKNVFAVHDSVMNEIGTMLKINKQLRHRTDSLTKLATTDASATVRIEEEKAQITQLTKRLDEAETLMNNWMYGYKGDTLQQLKPEQALAYLKQQQTKIDDVKQKFNSSIGQAQAYLKNSGLLLVLFLGLASCDSSGDKLPILGEREAITKVVGGKSVVDSVYHTIPDFRFASQYGDTVSAATLNGKIYVADFFFTTCPTICPKMKVQLKRVYAKYKGNPEVMLLSHTIDPNHDTVPVLKEFAQELGVTGRQWLFVTGDREKIYDIGQNFYMVTAKEDASAAGGVVHSGAFVLVDKAKHVRGVYDGTTEEGVDRLMTDMNKLLAEDKK